MADAASETVLNKFSGHYKILADFSRSAASKEDIFSVLQRLRLIWEPQLNAHWDANITVDEELLLHDFGNTPDFALIRQKDLKTLAFWDTDKTVTDEKHVFFRSAVYRAYATYHREDLRVTMGKQLIDWGRMRFYSPLDIFNPPLPSDIEPEERVGFDAFNVELFNEEFSGLSFVFGPGPDEEGTSFGLRGFKKIGTYDIFAVAADHHEDLIFGFGWDGYIKDAGFRGEFTYTKNGGDEGARVAVGCDYNFGSKTYAAAEYFYNGLANGDTGTFSVSLLEQRRRLTLKKNLVGIMASHELTPLIKIKGAVICDLDGKSAFFNPEVRYSARANLDLAAGAQIFVERSGGEFAGYENVYYVEAKLFF
ncbi:MAG: hypothetical protein ACM3L6_00485 [Deltaproteobacteria bacterium]